MSRLEKKCFIASAGTHALMLSLLFLAPALFVSPQKQKITLPIINFIPSRIIDGAISGGGSPTAKTAPAPAAAAQVAAPPTPAPAASPPVEPKVARKDPPAKSRPDAKATVKPDETSDPAAVKPSRNQPRVKVNLTKRAVSNSRDNSADESRARAEAAARDAQTKFAKQRDAIIGAISQGMSSGTTIDVPGPGGAAFADYRQVVELVYRKAWSPPRDLADDSATAQATVIIRRNGTVESFTVTRRSGHAILDRSVERLRNLPPLPPFPKEAPDDKRTFIINFNLKAKRSLG